MNLDYVYRIRHVPSGKYFVTAKNKSLWFSESASKTAYAHQTREYFDQQENHEIVKFRLVEQKKSKDKEKPTGYYYQK